MLQFPLAYELESLQVISVPQYTPPNDQDLGKIAREIVNETIYGKNVKDNVTVILIALNRGVEKE